jgi:hypothetical protein
MGEIIMTNKMITEYNHDTKETIEREMTDAEQAQHEAILLEAAEGLAKIESDKVSRQVVEDKLKALGLTSDDLRLLGL